MLRFAEGKSTKLFSGLDPFAAEAQDRRIGGRRITPTEMPTVNDADSQPLNLPIRVISHPWSSIQEIMPT